MERPDIVVFVHSGEWERLHQAYSIAVAGAVAGRSVDVYLFWWALERFAKDALDAPEFSGREETAERFSEQGFPTIRRMWESARATGKVRTWACTGSMAILALGPERLRERVDGFVGWAAILERTEGVTDRFFL
jgi:peroxiredoxin family protein